jgi:tRNA nucleotidyltransferase (CCA-adding enzyme)
VDIVPCYRLKSAEKIKSAVDRTPFHHEWLKDRIKGKESEVRMLKKFLKAGGIYGAEYKVRGFSGYLCELLIVFYGSFYRVVENATKWTRNTVLDVLNNRAYRKKGLKNMLVIDPVDAKRNVAANLSLDNLARFVERCRNFLENPSVEFFIEKALPTQPIRAEIEKRGTGLYVVEFEKPDIVEDNLYPQLERACKKIHEFLKRSKFMPLRSAHFVGKKCYLIFETEVKELSKIEKHEGPPFEDYENVKKFLERRKYAPFIENGKYFVYAERRHCKAEDAIADFVQKEWRALGKNIGEKLRKCRILKDEFENLGFLFDFLSLKR